MCLPLAAQPKLLVNAQTDTRTAASGLEAQFRTLLAAQPQPAWIGYSVPSTRTNSLGCDYVRDGFSSPGVVHLEPPDHAVILFRVENGVVGKIRTLSPDCEIDAGGLPVHWLNDVQPAHSIALLVSMAGERERLGYGMIAAIAVHGDPAADQALERFLAPGEPPSLRERTVNWLAPTRGRHGFELLKKLAASDPDERVRERAVTAMGSSKEPDAFDTLASIARNDPEPRLRSQAVSALSRRPGKATVDILIGIAAKDSDSSVRRRAVSSLQNMPDGEGIPALIQMARGSQDPEIRKQAMSGLGSSRDPRAVAFFEEVLKR